MVICVNRNTSIVLLKDKQLLIEENGKAINYTGCEE
jgi:hypothetical protein